MTWTNKLWKFNTTPDDVEMTALQADITAFANGDTGAPKLKTAGFNNLAVDTAEIAASAITQSKLSTATNEFSWTANSGPSGEASGRDFTLAGGEYSFYPQVKHDSGTGVVTHVISAYWYGEPTDEGLTNTLNYKTHVGMQWVSGNVVQYVTARYIQASPPYDLGDGICHLFIFCLRKKSTGEIIATSIAPDAPWHNNGPTNIQSSKIKHVLVGDGFDHRKLKADAEFASRLLATDGNITDQQMATMKEWSETIGYLDTISVSEEVPQSVKNKDMNLIPHPFGNVPEDHEVILLDPISELSKELLSLQEDGELISPLLNSGFFEISSKELARIGPPGVKTVSYRWK